MEFPHNSFLIPSQFVQKMYVNETGLLAIFGILTKHYTCFATKKFAMFCEKPCCLSLSSLCNKGCSDS